MADPDALRVRVHSITYQTDEVVVYEFRDPEHASLPTFDPGSHIDVHLSETMVRSYSLIDAGDPSCYRIAVAREDGGRGGSRWMHENMSVGDLVRISQPRNNFRLQPDAAHTVLVAGGIGITPLFAMLQWLDARAMPWELHYSTGAPHRTTFRRELTRPFEAGTVHFYHPKVDGRRMDVDAVVAGAPAGTHFYCCGPARLIDAFGDATAGLPGDVVHVERFSAHVDAAAGGFEVILARSNRTLTVADGQTILDRLLAEGIEVPNSCREGVCGACETRLLDGVGDHRDLIQSNAEKAANKSIFVCCSGSLTPSLRLDL